MQVFKAGDISPILNNMFEEKCEGVETVCSAQIRMINAL